MITTPAKTANESSHFPVRSATPSELIMRAKGMRSLLREQAAEAELQGHYLPEVHQAMVDAGFYHMLTPHCYGGLEVDLATYSKVIIEMGRGDPGSAWCFTLGHGHVLTTAAYWTEPAQRAVFNNDKGYFRASHSFVPSGTAKRVDGGLLINARSPYQSGVTYSTHATVNVELEASDTEPAQSVQVLLPEGQYKVLDDWGGDAVLGMRSSGSNTVLVENQVVPEYFAARGKWLEKSEFITSYGTELYGNPLYLGAWQGFTKLELCSIIIGAAWATIDEYEKIARARTSILPPYGPRYQHPIHQLHLGQAKMLTDSAEAIAMQCAQLYGQWSKDAVERGIPLTIAMDTRVFSMLAQAGKMASEAVEILFRSGGSAAAKRDEPLQRYMRDVQMYRTHVAAQYDTNAMRVGAMQFGEASSIFGGF